MCPVGDNRLITYKYCRTLAHLLLNIFNYIIIIYIVSIKMAEPCAVKFNEFL